MRAGFSPSANVVSNVPGPKEHLYLRGARLEATYPVSIPGHSMALNITAHSYAGRLDLGFIGDREALPHLQRLAVSTGEALEHLERVLTSFEAYCTVTQSIAQGIPVSVSVLYAQGAVLK